MIGTASGFAEQDPQSAPAPAACSSTNWRVLAGPSIGHGDVPARHRESEVELEVASSPGFEVGRSSVVYSAQGNQLLVEIKNLEARWRCGIRSYPSLAYDAQGQRTDAPVLDDTGYRLLGATGMHTGTSERIRGSCLGPAETGYLQIRLSEELARVSLRLEATSDDPGIGPPQSCIVPESYTYSAGRLAIQAHRAGLADTASEAVGGGGLAMVLVLDEEQLPLALFPVAPVADDASDPAEAAFAGIIGFSGGTSQRVAVLVW